MSEFNARPAQEWVFIESPEYPPQTGVITAVGVDIDKCLVGSEVKLGDYPFIELPLGGFAVRFSDVTLVNFYD